jgi:hypothetical protein
MIWKGCTVERSGPNLRYYPRICLEGLKNTNKPTSTASLWAEIWTQDLLNMKHSATILATFCHVIKLFPNHWNLSPTLIILKSCSYKETKTKEVHSFILHYNKYMSYKVVSETNMSPAEVPSVLQSTDSFKKGDENSMKYSECKANKFNS